MLLSASQSHRAPTNRKRRSDSRAKNPENRQKAPKVSRACDHCKTKKLKCSGTIPCNICTRKSLDCLYDAQYRRGRPPTPPAALFVPNHHQSNSDASSGENRKQKTPTVLLMTENSPVRQSGAATSRSSPALGAAEIEGQIVDPTSNLSFIHRAWRRLALQKQHAVPNVLTGTEHFQPLMSAGDKPFLSGNSYGSLFLDPQSFTDLFNFYFENCVITYRFLNQSFCSTWLQTVIHNCRNSLPLFSNIDHAKAAIVVNILAIASLRKHKASVVSSETTRNDSFILQQSEDFFNASLQLTSIETGLPRLESAQARILQVLYLLQTSRMNQAWHVFGCTVPIVLAISLHRKSIRSRPGGTRTPNADYITTEFRKRTFWVVYTIDKYLAIVFGRPRFYHNDDVDQDFPDRVNDEDMTPDGPSDAEPTMDYHVDSLIFHAKVAKIIDNISREIYSAKPLSNLERLEAVQGFNHQLQEWRKELPPHLGAVRPSSLNASFSRQATALKLAYCHAIMHANRPFLLDQPSNCDSDALQECVSECVGAARVALETINRMFINMKVPYGALWWTPYVTFCALAVVYVLEIQQKSFATGSQKDSTLFSLAEKCQSHLTRTLPSESPSRRYAIIIEELRLEAVSNGGQDSLRADATESEEMNHESNGREMTEQLNGGFHAMFDGPTDAYASASNPIGQWQASDWLDLDFSAFGLSPDVECFMSS
ncbi:fungal-specific transcription factor domain-containing protein [Phyllosticta citribraziliensis]